MARTIVLVAAALFAASCGGGNDATATVAVPDGATFCSVFTGEYTTALANAVPITDDGFQESVDSIVAWAEVLVDLAPDEIGPQAADNLQYHEAQAAVRSASDFIPGSNEMHAWANANC